MWCWYFTPHPLFVWVQGARLKQTPYRKREWRWGFLLEFMIIILFFKMKINQRTAVLDYSVVHSQHYQTSIIIVVIVIITVGVYTITLGRIVGNSNGFYKSNGSFFIAWRMTIPLVHTQHVCNERRMEMLDVGLPCIINNNHLLLSYMYVHTLTQWWWGTNAQHFINSYFFRHRFSALYTQNLLLFSSSCAPKGFSSILDAQFFAVDEKSIKKLEIEVICFVFCVSVCVNFIQS